MFKRVHADPNGDVTFEYGSFAVKVDRNGTSHIRSNLFKKGNYGSLDTIRDSSVKHISNKLHKHI